MCGRYALPIKPETLPEWFARQNVNVENVEHSEQSTEHEYNIAPTESVPVYFKENGNTGRIDYMKWGLTPNYKTNKRYNTFNARYENLYSNILWKSNLKNRCVVPIMGYYEWQTNGKKKIPYYIKRKDGELIFLAGLYHENKETNTRSFTIITREAPDMLKWLHSRMPIVLNPRDKSFNQWLDDEEKQVDISNVLKVYSGDDDIEWYRVDPSVGNSRTDSKKYVLPLREPLLEMFRKKEIKIKRERDEEEEKKEEKGKDNNELEHRKSSSSSSSAKRIKKEIT